MKRIAKRQAKKVMQFDLAGTYLKTWSGAKEASLTLGINDHHIRAACNGKDSVGKRRLTAGGYIWSWEGPRNVGYHNSRCNCCGKLTDYSNLVAISTDCLRKLKNV